MRSRGVAAVLITLTVLVAAGLAANPPAIQWQRTYFGEGVARGGWVEPTSDGGYIAAGHSVDPDTDRGFNYFLIKVDSLGNPEWERFFGGEYDAQAFCVKPTASGGYVVVGSAEEPFPGAVDNTQPYLLATDGNGYLLWQRVYVVDTLEMAYSILQTPDGGFIIGGINPSVVPGMDSGLCVFKTDSLGLLEWQRSYRVGRYRSWTEVIPVELAHNGGYIVGTRNLLKMDTLGNMEWLRNYEKAGDTHSVIRTSDGGYVATGPGVHGSSFKDWDSISVYLLKTDSGGNLIWLRHLGGIDSEGGYNVVQASDSGFIIVAQAVRESGGLGGLVIRTDADGCERWKLHFEGPRPSAIRCVRNTPDGGFIVAGWTTAPPDGHTGLTLWKFGPDGQ
jgi:hypothetical protein